MEAFLNSSDFELLAKYLKTRLDNHTEREICADYPSDAITIEIIKGLLRIVAELTKQ